MPLGKTLPWILTRLVAVWYENLTHPAVLAWADLPAEGAAPLCPRGRAHPPSSWPACSLASLGFYLELSYVVHAEWKYLFGSIRRGLFSLYLKDIAMVSP